MQMVAVSGRKGQGKTITASLLPLYLRDKRCFIMSYYEAIEYVSPGISRFEVNTVKAAITTTCPNFFTDAIKLKRELYRGIYDVLIIDDIETEYDMQKIKHELDAVIIGVVKEFPYSVPYKAREELISDIMGEPDIIVKNEMTMNKLHVQVFNAVEKLKKEYCI